MTPEKCRCWSRGRVVEPEGFPPAVAYDCGALRQILSREGGRLHLGPDLSGCLSMLTEAERWRRFVHAVVVAGKSAAFARAACNRLFGSLRTRNPREDLARWLAAGTLKANLRSARTGNYERISRALTVAVEAELDLSRVTVPELESVPGIGPKTARFFLLWTRPNVRAAALDVHVTRWLGAERPGTPPAREYAVMEARFLAEADARGISPRHLDALIWAAGSGESYAAQGG